MTADPYKGMSVAYNFLNLPHTFTFPNGSTKIIQILYDASGRKLRKTVTDGGTQVYRQDDVGGIEYRSTSTVSLSLESIYHPEGRVFNTNTGTTGADALRYEYSIRDHLGNTRLTFTDKNNNGRVDISTTSTNEVLSESHYYPFGLALNGPWIDDAAARDNPYRYNGKELNSDFGLGWYDYGARWYDAAVGRWSAVDPLAEKYASWSGYNYVMNNPLIYIDPDGRDPEWVPKVGSDGSIVLQAEANVNLQTLQAYLKGSDYEEQASQLWDNRSHNGGTHVTLPFDNYSQAFAYAKEHSDEFSDKQQQDNPQNYNCYHFAINGVWEKPIYSFWSSFGEYNMDPVAAQRVLNEFFKTVTPNEAIFGETIIGVNYSGGLPQHFMVYAGMDNSGNIYVMQKYGMSEAPSIIKMAEVGTGEYNDYKFYNENGAHR